MGKHNQTEDHEAKNVDQVDDSESNNFDFHANYDVFLLQADRSLEQLKDDDKKQGENVD